MFREILVAGAEQGAMIRRGSLFLARDAQCVHSWLLPVRQRQQRDGGKPTVPEPTPATEWIQPQPIESNGITQADGSGHYAYQKMRTYWVEDSGRVKDCRDKYCACCSVSSGKYVKPSAQGAQSRSSATSALGGGGMLDMQEVSDLHLLGMVLSRDLAQVVRARLRRAGGAFWSLADYRRCKNITCQEKACPQMRREQPCAGDFDMDVRSDGHALVVGESGLVPDNWVAQVAA